MSLNKTTFLRCILAILIGIFVFEAYLLMHVTSGSNAKAMKLKKGFDSLCREEKFSGVALVSFDNKIVFEQACGYANRSFNVPNNINTKFNIGSVGKLFTSVAIAQLAEKNTKLLTAPLNTLVPNWLSQEQNPITVQQLLVHSAGLSNFMDDKRWKIGADSALYINLNDYIPLVRDQTLLFSPGISQLYSNSGYLLLGAVIEAVTQDRYADYIRQHVFAQAGMRNTDIYRLDETVQNQAVGYTQECNNGICHWLNNYFHAPFIGNPAGGAYSTVEDLYKFAQSLHQNKLLSREITKQVLSTDTVVMSHDLIAKKIALPTMDNIQITETMSSYGFAGAWNKFGFAVWEKPLLLGHSGGTVGASALLAMSPDGKYTIVILSNASGAGPYLMYQIIRSALGMSSDVTNY